MTKLNNDDNIDKATELLDKTTIDAAENFNADLDKFLLNFSETWEDSVDIRTIILTQIISLQHVSLELIEIIAGDAAENSFDLLGEMADGFAKREKEIRAKYNLKERRGLN